MIICQRDVAHHAGNANGAAHDAEREMPLRKDLRIDTVIIRPFVTISESPFAI